MDELTAYLADREGFYGWQLSHEIWRRMDSYSMFNRTISHDFLEAYAELLWRASPSFVLTKEGHRWLKIEHSTPIDGQATWLVREMRDGEFRPLSEIQARPRHG